jgi:hypothetical protein
MMKKVRNRTLTPVIPSFSCVLSVLLLALCPASSASDINKLRDSGDLGQYAPLLRKLNPSFDKSSTSISIDGKMINIPRNYLVDIDVENGEILSVDLRAFLPDFTGISDETIGCFNIQRECFQMIVIGVSRSERVSTQEHFNNLQKMGYAQASSLFGLQIFRDKNFDIDESREEYLVEFRENIAKLLIRCGKSENRYSICVVQKGVTDRLCFIYLFSREHLKDWNNINVGVIRLLGSFGLKMESNR